MYDILKIKLMNYIRCGFAKNGTEIFIGSVPEDSLDHAISLLAVTKNPSYLRFPFAFRIEYPAFLTRICAKNALGVYYLCAHARKLVPDSVDSSTSNCWSLEGVVHSWGAGAAEKSSASTPLRYPWRKISKKRYPDHCLH